MYTSILSKRSRKAKKSSSKINFDSISFSESLALIEKLKTSGRSRSQKEEKKKKRKKQNQRENKKCRNQKWKERPSTSINQHRERESKETLELKVQLLERKLSLLKQKNKWRRNRKYFIEATLITCSFFNTITKDTKQPQFAPRNKKYSHLCQWQIPIKIFNFKNMQQLHQTKENYTFTKNNWKDCREL